jgi:hypothetical protein
MTILAIIAISVWVLTVIGFVIFNLYQKNLKMERALVSRDIYVENLKIHAEGLDTVINKMDLTMWVQSDPELKALFDTIKSFNDTIKQYNKNVS